MTGPYGAYLSLAASADGTTIAAGDHHGAVTLFNAVDGRALGSFGIRQTKIQSVAFSTDGKLLAAGGHDGMVQLWNVAARTYCGQTSAHGDRVWCVTFSADGRRLVTASRDRSIKLWELAGQLQPRREKLDALSFAIAFSKHEQTLGFFQDWRLRLWPRDSAHSRQNQGTGEGYESAVAWAAGRWFLCRREGDRRAFESTDDQVCLVRPDGGDINRFAILPTANGWRCELAPRKGIHGDLACAKQASSVRLFRQASGVYHERRCLFQTAFRAC